MFLGRSTLQWTGLITAGVALSTVLLVQAGVDPKTVATLLGSIGTFLGVLIAFIANTSTTPVSDPRLPNGTSVTVTDPEGNTLGKHTVTA